MSINNKKIISDQDCLDVALSSVKNIYAFSQFYKDFDDKNTDLITPPPTSGYAYSSRLSKSILFSQMKKKQLVSKSKNLYRKTKESYIQRRRNSNAHKDEESTSLLQFATAKRLYSNYISNNSHYNFICYHSPLKHFFGSDSKSIEKFSLVYKDHSKITEDEMINMMKFLKALSSINIDDKPTAEIIKLFISHFLKHYNAVSINCKRHTDRNNNLNDLTPLEFMVSVETWISRYINLVYTTIEIANASVLNIKSSLVETDVSIFENNSDENTMFDVDDIYSRSLNDNSSMSLYSEDTFANHSICQSGLKASTPLAIQFTLDDLDSKIIDESCNSPISEKIDTIYPRDNLQNDLEVLIKEKINTHNHEHCLQVIQSRPLHYFELPFPYRENMYIINGYRFYDFKTSLTSIFSLIPVLSKPSYSKHACSGGEMPHLYHWHNETVNIWTHLVAAFYFLHKFLTFRAIYSTRSQNVSISIFFLMSFSCFILSSLWHTLSGWNVVQRRSKACCLDYSGISMLIVSSIVAVQCCIVPQAEGHNLQMYVWIAVSVMLLCMSLILNWHPKFDTPEFRSVRILVFVSMAAVGNISIITLNYEKKGEHFLLLCKNSFVWYLLGVFFYGSFIFERFRKDCLIRRIPTMAERTENIDLIQREKHLYFKTDPYSPAGKIVSSDELEKIDEEISEEIDHFEHGFKSLWWTDYYLQSHNIWHVMVIMGCLGHFRAVEKILENMN